MSPTDILLVGADMLGHDAGSGVVQGCTQGGWTRVVPSRVYWDPAKVDPGLRLILRLIQGPGRLEGLILRILLINP